MEELHGGNWLVVRGLNEDTLPLLQGMTRMSADELAEAREGFFSYQVPTRLPTPEFLRNMFFYGNKTLMGNYAVWKSGVINRMKANYCMPLTVLSRQRLLTAAVARVILLMIGKKCLTDRMICKAFDEVVYTDCETMEGVKL